jgi:selenocysteine lyase/cysteine desulfurase
MNSAMSPLERFKQQLDRDDLVQFLREGLVGENACIEGPAGPKQLLYADYVASGRALHQIESFILNEVLPYYANSHTEASYCGSFTTRLREEARREIMRIVGAGEGTSVIFAGSGATAGINKLVRLLDIERRTRAGERIVVFVGPYEHHSNLLPWRESGAEIVEIEEASGGGPDLDRLSEALTEAAKADLLIGAFSAASNVTGIVTATGPVTRLLKKHGALAFWDYAGGAPYLPLSMAEDTDASKDAIVFSPHKFPGGPGASGILVLCEDIVAVDRPTAPGGGSVRFVSPWEHDYSLSLVSREEAGTPNIIGDVRAALVLLVKEAVGQAYIDSRDAQLRRRAMERWKRNPFIEMLDGAGSLPIFSFRIRDGRGGHIHHQLFTRMLSDYFGIQARGGCACAGPYAHRLLGIEEQASHELSCAIRSGREIEKPGWIRLNFSYLLDDGQAEAIINGVDRLARSALDYSSLYRCDTATARFTLDAKDAIPPAMMPEQSQIWMSE